MIERSPKSVLTIICFCQIRYCDSNCHRMENGFSCSSDYSIKMFGMQLCVLGHANKFSGERFAVSVIMSVKTCVLLTDGTSHWAYHRFYRCLDLILTVLFHQLQSLFEFILFVWLRVFLGTAISTPWLCKHHSNKHCFCLFL